MEPTFVPIFLLSPDRKNDDGNGEGSSRNMKELPSRHELSDSPAPSTRNYTVVECCTTAILHFGAYFFEKTTQANELGHVSLIQRNWG